MTAGLPGHFNKRLKAMVVCYGFFLSSKSIFILDDLTKYIVNITYADLIKGMDTQGESI
jgi:hypothetical protein